MNPSLLPPACRALGPGIACLLWLATVACARERASWPQLRGPGGSGVAPEGMKLPLHFGPDRNLLWRTPLPPGHSSPCIWGEGVFLTGFAQPEKRLETICLDRHDGRILWRRTAPATAIERCHAISTPANPTPATDGERVYVYFGSFGLLCYDFTGNERWRLPLPVPKTADGSGTSPVVAGGLVLLNCAYPPKPCLLAAECRTGRVAWRAELAPTWIGLPGHATPVLWSRDGTEEAILHTPLRLAGHSLKDGAERWWVDVATTGCSTPAVGEGRLFVATWFHGGEPQDRVRMPPFDALLKQHDRDGDGALTKREFPPDLSFIRRPEADDVYGRDLKLIEFFDAFDTDKDGRLDANEWERVTAGPFNRIEHGLMAVNPGGSGDVGKTHVAWKETRGVAEVPSPLVYQRRIYMVRDGGTASCLDAETGRLLWRERLGAVGGYYASPVAGDGKVYFASARGVVTVVAAGDSFQRLAANDLREPLYATPAIAEGRLYIRTARHLHAFGE
ncbi:MAG: hypothetical protein FJ290_16275 [Planctomycetes bacterium]|nr:hypothetical protein [Planctomycetota bacterium]